MRRLDLVDDPEEPGNRKDCQHNQVYPKFSKVAIFIRSFLQIFYHSITTKVVAINIQELETVIQDVSLHHSSITSETLHFIILLKNSTLFSFAFEKAYEIIE